MHNKHKNIIFHIFTDYFDKENQEKFKQMAKQNGSNANIHIVNFPWLKNLPNSKNWSYAVYFKLLAADYLSDQIARFLYLDCDIICKGDLDELINLDIRQYVAAVVADRNESWWEKRAEALDTPAIASGYFNAGVMLVNLTNWENESVTKNTIRNTASIMS